jgi:phage terminase large subunit GpA-like protein
MTPPLQFDYEPISLFSVASSSAWHLKASQGIVEWCEKNRYLSSKYTAPEHVGLWRSAWTPYAAAPLEAFTDPNVVLIVLVMASQTGKTVGIENMMFYTVAEDPQPIMWVIPHQKLIEDHQKRLRATIDASPVLRGLMKNKAAYVSRTGIQAEACEVSFRLATSGQLSSTPAGKGFFDELDKADVSTRGEGSPLDQLAARGRTFIDHKNVVASTPGEHPSPIEKEFENTSQEEWEIPCPGCGDWHEWKTRDVKWTKRPLDVERKHFLVMLEHGEVDVWWQCPHCGEKVSGQAEKNAMNAKGRWTARNPAVTRRRGFHLTSLASPAISFREYAVMYYHAALELRMGSPEAMQHFTQHQEARAWRNEASRPEARVIKAAAKPNWPRDYIPDGYQFTVVGIDVQRAGVYMQARSYESVERRVHVPRWGFFPGDWRHIVPVLLRTLTFARNQGRRTHPKLWLIDSGDPEVTGDVYALSAEWTQQMRRKGLDIEIAPIHGVAAAQSLGKLASRSQNKREAHGGRLVLAHVDALKTAQAHRLSRRLQTFCADAADDDEFAAQMTAEVVRQARDKRGKLRSHWECPVGAANHYGDAGIYCDAGAVLLGWLKGVPTRRASGSGGVVGRAALPER